MQNSTIRVSDQTVHVDNEGFLLDPEDWNIDVANKMAETLNIEMGDHHWRWSTLYANTANSDNLYPKPASPSRPCVRN